jgi:hypothetical protein
MGRRREEAQILGPPDFSVGHDAVPQEEPPGSPTLAVIGPLVEHPGHRALRSPRITVGSAGKPCRQAPGPPQRRRGGSVPDTPAGALQRYAAKWMQFFHSHFGNTKMGSHIELSISQKRELEIKGTKKEGAER